MPEHRHDSAPSARVDLNADLGEGFGRWSLGDDDAMLELVTSANIACGFHAGDPALLRDRVRTAQASGVTIGAQVSYRDLAGFGRRFIDVAPRDLTAEVIYQIGALDALARAEGGAVRYVKPHGALYNAIVQHEGQARAVVDAVLALDPALPLVGLPGSAVLREAEAAGIRVIREGFADRGYLPDGSLVPRSRPDALVHDPGEVAARVVRMVVDGTVVAVDGSVVPLTVDSVCVHGDSPDAVGMAAAVRAGLASAGVGIAPFTAP